MPAAQTSPEGPGLSCPQQFYGRDSFRSQLIPVGAVFAYAAVSVRMTVCDPMSKNGSCELRGPQPQLVLSFSGPTQVV